MNKATELDQLDKMIAIGSGTLAAAVDILYVPELSFKDAADWGNEKISSFVILMAQNSGYRKDDISGAIAFLRKKKIKAQDILADSVSFGTTGTDLLADQLGISGLIFSIFTYMTGKQVGVNAEGKYVCENIENFEKKSLDESIYWGTLRWIFNLVYSVVDKGFDSIGSALDTEIPTAIKDILTKLLAYPRLYDKINRILETEEVLHNKELLFKKLSDSMYDAIEKGSDGKPHWSAILGVVHEMVGKKQYLPVVVNEVIVSSFYTLSRLFWQLSIYEINTYEDLKLIDINVCLPYKNEAILSMRKIAHTTFMAINIMKAGVNAATKCKKNVKDFGIHFLQSINYYGVISWLSTLGPECGTYFEHLYETFKNMAEDQKAILLSALQKVNEGLDNVTFIMNSVKNIAQIASPMNYVEAVKDVYDTIREAYEELELAKEHRREVEAACAEHIMELQKYEAEMQAVVEDYFIKKYAVFTMAFDTIDKAMSEEDIELFISGQNMIQKELSGKVLFENMEQFDDLMESNDAIVF